MTNLFQDARFALRSLMRSKSFAVVASSHWHWASLRTARSSAFSTRFFSDRCRTPIPIGW